MVERTLVTGASGFIGSALVQEMIRRGVRTCVLINSTSAGIPWRLRSYWGHLCVHEANLLDPFAVQRQFVGHQPDVVVHLAAFTHAGRSWARSSECYMVNVLGTLNLAHALEANKACHFVYVSSSEVYGRSTSPPTSGSRLAGRPLSPYAASKLGGEDLIQVFAARGDFERATIVRPFNVYGPRQSPDRIIPEAIQAALTDRDLAVTSGEQTRDFIFVDDVVEGLLALSGEKVILQRNGTVYDFASGVNTSMREVVNYIFALSESRGVPKFGELRQRPNELPATLGNDADLRTLLGREVLDLREGLKRTLNSYRRLYSDER